MENNQNIHHNAPQQHVPQDIQAVPIQPVINHTVNNPAPVASKSQHSSYHSNPFALNLDGLVYVFQNNGTSGLLLYFLDILIIGAVGMVGTFFLVFSTLLGPLVFILVPILALAYFYFISAMSGSLYSLAVSSFEGQAKKADAFIKTGFKRAFPLLGLSIILSLMVIVGTVLLVVPGMLLFGWYSLAPYAMISENLGVFASLKRSKELSKGHIWEIYGAYASGFILSGGGLLAGIVLVAGVGKRYEELKELKASGAPKPEVHWLNWLIPVLMIIFIVGYIGLIAISVAAGNLNKSLSNPPTYTNTSVST
jgi:hypothetical protein